MSERKHQWRQVTSNIVELVGTPYAVTSTYSRTLHGTWLTRWCIWEGTTITHQGYQTKQEAMIDARTLTERSER